MATSTASRDHTAAFSDLLTVSGDGLPLVHPAVHPVPNLLTLDAEQVLDALRAGQLADFSRVIAQLDDSGHSLNRLVSQLRDVAARQPGNPFSQLALFRPGALRTLFLELHAHVLDHPVWRHPCFLRIFSGDFSHDQLRTFATHYFNQVKNTRQCVALALGRFSSVMPMPYGVLNERISELGQIVLAQLLADEYGVGTHSLEDYPTLDGLFGSTTHIVMYRRLLEGLEIPFEAQDVPMLPGVADNVLTQRLLAGHPDFTLVEALASVGLGMEWGVPEFFSLLLGGMVRWAWHNDVPLRQHHLSIFSTHVHYDTLHAVSVMLATCFFSHEGDAEHRIKQATNTLMASRYTMMSAIHRHVFGEPCAGIDEIGLDSRYLLDDRRIEVALRLARRGIAPDRVVGGDAYRDAASLPYAFRVSA